MKTDLNKTVENYLNAFEQCLKMGYNSKNWRECLSKNKLRHDYPFTAGLENIKRPDYRKRFVMDMIVMYNRICDRRRNDLIIFEALSTRGIVISKISGEDIKTINEARKNASQMSDKELVAEIERRRIYKNKAGNWEKKVATTVDLIKDLDE